MVTNPMISPVMRRSRTGNTQHAPKKTTASILTVRLTDILEANAQVASANPIRVAKVKNERA